MIMKNKLHCWFVLISVGILFLYPACSPDKKPIEIQDIGEFAPDDAFLDGSEHPYYGSENPWNRRFFTEHIKNYYKRRGQRQMLDIMEGRVKEAAAYCQELLEKDPHDLESLFNLAVAQAQLGDVNTAVETAGRALQAGLPFGRFVAGPRDVLLPLTSSTEFQTLASNYDADLIHGPLLGNMTDHSVTVWVRTATQAEVIVIASTDKDFSAAIHSTSKKTKSEDDFTTMVALEDLESSTVYFYDVLIDGKSTLKPDYPSFKTYPKSDQPSNIKVGFGGGAGYVPDNERIWDTILSHRPDAFLFLGDNVYINMPETPNAVHYYTYYRRQSRAEFRGLVSSTAIYAIWDDHDAATDDVWLGPYREKPPWKMWLLNVFRQNWNNPGYGDAEWPGCWFSFSIGDIEFFMLDGRFYRTNPYDKRPTMLGPIQKNWLLSGLKESRTRFKVLVSPVPWSLASKGGARDTWNGFKEEREEIFNLIAQNKINGVFLLSADRHRSDAWKIERKSSYPLYEFESSRLTNQHFHELMPNALFGYNQKQSFGLLKFNMESKDPTVVYQIISIDNEITHSLTLKLSEISHP
jgi:alkaline phosphatase D